MAAEFSTALKRRMARPIFNPAGLNRPKLAFSLSRAGFYPRRLRGAGKPEVGALLYRVARPPGRRVARWWCGGQFGALLCQYRPVVVVRAASSFDSGPGPGVTAIAAQSGGPRPRRLACTTTTTAAAAAPAVRGARVSLKLGRCFTGSPGRRVARWWCGGQFGALLCQYRPVVVVQRPVPLTAAPAPASSIAAQSGGPGPGDWPAPPPPPRRPRPRPVRGGAGKPEVGGAALPGRPAAGSPGGGVVQRPVP